ncbi:hypothetical protein ANCCAN_05461 [Ancylostoma caninum]|uniref:Uncharacterized protein n=1 Tax=Ancylostoma caninum TaxID=29170 RepID=A0A368GVR0_ANCCA|nr:hypothetical protein ANCCAN_05461 [Ancylostoma caninum]
MPKLDEVMQQQAGVRVKIGDNEQLEMTRSDVKRLVAAAGGLVHADIQRFAYDKRHVTSRSTLDYITYCAVAPIIVISCLVLFFFVRIKPRLGFDMLPPPPLRLSKKSQTILGKMCRNGHISRKSEKAFEKRIQSILSQPLILMVGNDGDISKVVSSMPNENGVSDEYENSDSSMKVTLTRSKFVGDQTVNYIYKATTQRKGEKPVKKKVHVLLYVWESLRLPIEFQDILQLFRFFANKKIVCVSNRRKEVFSMLHLIYTYVYVLCQSIGVVEAFQLHTETCNGAPLDSNEMLMVMAFILEWAHQSFSVPQDLLQKHADWCHTYARMSAFSKEHPNIVSIRPDHLVTSRRATLQQEIEAAGPRPGAVFSERPEEAAVDKVRRRTKAELKRRGQTFLRKDEQKKAQEEEETETNGPPPETSGVLFQKRYRAGPDDPFRIAEEKRIAEALKRRTKLEVNEKSAVPKTAQLPKSACDRTRAAGTKTAAAGKVSKSGSMMPKSWISSKRKKSNESKKTKSQSRR